MEENNDIFLAGGDALVYSAEPMHQKYSLKFVWSYPFSTYVSYDQFFNSTPPARTCTLFGWLPFHSISTYLMDGLFLNQKTNYNIRILYSLKYKHSKKKKFFLKSHTRPKIFHLISVTLSHINGIIIVPFKSYLSQCW